MGSKKLILLILDGWGYRDTPIHNATVLSDPVNFNRLIATDPHVLIEASGEYVGLPEGQMGNSEVGHTNMGAGRVVYQDLVKISRSFDMGDADKIPAFIDFINTVKNKNGRLHLVGLLSDGGVHSHISHFKSILHLAKKHDVPEVYVHVLTDGRDTPPLSGIDYVQSLEKWMDENKIGKIADISGRFYGMDRDKRWERIEKNYNILRHGLGKKASSGAEAIKAAYDSSVTDEFIVPAAINDVDGTVKDGDGIFFVNFRADRMRELLSVFYKDDFTEFDRGTKPQVDILTMTQYDESMPIPAMYPAEPLANILGELISRAGFKQLRIAETEKYAHVTYFFNGGREEPFPLEERILVPSPRDVPTYDLKPEMSAAEVTARFEERFAKGDLSLVVINFANPDMVGHSGVESATIAACKHVDEMLGRVIKAADKLNTVLIVTADHGNAEQMWDDLNNQPHTSHTTNPVPFIIHNYPAKFVTDRGKLADVAPTILKIMGMDIPAEMTGIPLIKE